MKNKLVYELLVGLLVVAALLFSWKYLTQPKIDQTANVTPTVTDSITPTPSAPVLEYTSTVAKLTLKFKSPMYVEETPQNGNDIPGTIEVSLYPLDQANGSLSVQFSSPEIEGKGGACDPDQNNNKSWTNLTVLGQKVLLCESPDYSAFGGYLLNKKGAVEYAFNITGVNNKTEYTKYREIITSGLTLK